LLVGLKKDLRDDPNARESLESAPVEYNEGLAMAKKINAYKYLECSAKTRDGIQEVFEHATRAALVKKAAPPQKKPCLIL